MDFDNDDTILDRNSLEESDTYEAPKTNLGTQFYNHLGQVLQELTSLLGHYVGHSGSAILDKQIHHLWETLQHLEHFTQNPNVGPHHDSAIKMTAKIGNHYIDMILDHGGKAIGAEFEKILEEIRSVLNDLVEGI